MISTDLDAARRDALVAACEASLAERESGSRMRTARLDFVDQCDEATVLALLRALTAAEATIVRLEGERDAAVVNLRMASAELVAASAIMTRDTASIATLTAERDDWHKIADLRSLEIEKWSTEAQRMIRERDAARAERDDLLLLAHDNSLRERENAHLRTRVAAAVDMANVARMCLAHLDAALARVLRDTLTAFDATATDVGPYHGNSNKNSKEE